MLLITAIAGLAVHTTSADDLPLVSKNTELNEILNQWISITTLDDQSTFASLNRRLRRNEEFSIVIDRRLNPDRLVQLPMPVSGSLATVMKAVATSQNSNAEIIGNTVLYVPDEEKYKLRTLITSLEDQYRKLVATPGSQSDRSAARIGQRKNYAWQRFSQPRQLILNTAESLNLNVQNPEIIPHDLWREGQILDCHAIEFFSLILFQYDLTFEWIDINSIRIVPINDVPVIKKTHRLGKTDPERLRETYLPMFPNSLWQTRGASSIQVTGPVELQEAVENQLAGKYSMEPTSRIPWKDRRYTMRVSGKSLSEVLTYLEQAGIPVEFDLEKMQESGVDVDEKLTFETTEADAKTLFEKICQPIKLPFQVTEDAIIIGSEE